MSTILRDSGTHTSERGNDNLKRVEEALRELHAKRVLMRYETDILRGKYLKVVDAKYTLYPDMDFVTEVKKSNSRTLKLSEHSLAIESEASEARSIPQNRAR
jgi:hypothetical protein